MTFPVLAALVALLVEVEAPPRPAGRLAVDRPLPVIARKYGSDVQSLMVR